MKKGWKIALISGVSILVLGGAWAGLTKAGVIPNWFEINLLDNYINCKGKVFRRGVQRGEGGIITTPTMNGKYCKEGTYSRYGGRPCGGDEMCLQ